jgi:predicted dehydrogenase
VNPLRIGLLGTARIAETALVRPAASVPEVTVAAVAAREQARAAAFAERYGIPVVQASYDALLANPDIDAVYNPLPNALHAPWTIKAIAAGKHVLCEKPLASCAAEAEQVAAAAAASGLVVMEAMHYRYHPLIGRLRELAAGLGPVRHIQCWTSFVISNENDIRYDYGLGGGALMDGGCYAIDCLRLLGPGEPAVTGALADPYLRLPGHSAGHPGPAGAVADRATAVSLAFPGGSTAWLESSFTLDGQSRAEVHVIGEHGHVWVTDFIQAHDGRLVAVRDGSVLADERGAGDTTYTMQLRAFAAAVAGGAPVPTSAAHAVGTMRLIDDAYRAAGLLPRPARALLAAEE